MAQLGRIGGHLLKDELVRDGVDLSFKNTVFDTALLYFDVNSAKIGINNDAPAFDLQINSDIVSTNGNATNQARFDNIIVDSTSNIRSLTGPIYVTPQTAGSYLEFQRMQSDDLDFNDNTISTKFSNTNMELQANGTGTIELQANTNVTGDLSLTGNILVDGNLSSAGNVIVGDSPLDTVTIVPDLTQTIKPGTDNEHDLGQQANDSSPRRWNEIYITDNLVNTTVVNPNAVTVSSQMTLDGVNNQIFAIQSNEDIELLPDTGITFIESTKWENNDITNLLNTPLTFSNTGIGYVRFMGDNAIRIPAGADSTRPSNPELGDTRWNTDEQYMESFLGAVESVSSAGNVSGLVNQTQTGITGTTSGNGVNAQFTFTISGGSLTVTVTTAGYSYVTGDTIIVLGTVFTGGTTPANDITLTVGAQTKGGYVISTGGGEEVTTGVMEDLGNVYSLILG